MTTIQDTLTYIDGSKANGRLVVSWKPFTVSGVNAAGGELEWEIVDGVVDISLYSNTGALPSGSYYVAKYELENGAVYNEQWMVPNLPIVNLGQVRVSFPPSPSVMISPLQLTSLNAQPGMFLMWDGTRWVPGYPSSYNLNPNWIIVAAGAAGNDVNVTGSPVSLGSAVTINVPDAGAAARGVVTTAAQTFAGSKTFANSLAITGDVNITGSYLVNGAPFIVAQSPWLVDIDAATHRLDNVKAIGVGAPAQDQVGVYLSTPITGGIVEALLGVSKNPTGHMGALFQNDSNHTFALRLYGSQSGITPNLARLEIAGADLSFAIGDRANDVIEQMRITQAGYVGMGTGNPSAFLTVAGSRATAYSADDAATWADVLSENWTTAAGAATGIGFSIVTSPFIGDRTVVAGIAAVRNSSAADADTSLAFITRAPGSPSAERMRITAAGLVGIGLLPAVYSLEVSGDVNVTGVYRVNGVPISSGGGGSVASVFTRTGAVVAQAGDYTAAQVTNAVSTLGSYADPAWITALAWAKITGVPALVPATRKVIAGFGLAGGGALSADVTLTAVLMGASGASHTAGLAPDPGAASGATRYLREDATWAIPSGAGGGLTDPTTTKGDLIVRGAAAVTRLGVGADGQVLVADAAQALGVKWAAASGGVASVFTRTGAVVAAAGDYTAAQVTNAVSVLGSYADPPWITSLAWAKITGAPGVGGQTPWLTDIDAKTHNLNNVGLMGIGLASASGIPLSIRNDAALRQIVTSTAGTDCGISLQCLAAGGRIYSFYSSGGTSGISAGVLGQGCFAIYDDTVGSTRLGITAAGDMYVPGQLGVQKMPGCSLDVAGIIRSTSGTIDLRVQAGASSAAGVGTFSNDPLLFFVNSIETMRITTAGHVGINTQTAVDWLSITCVPFAGNANGGIRLQSPSAEWVARLALKSNAGGAPRFALDFGTETVSVIQGHVGVNAIAPAYELDVTGTARTTAGFLTQGKVGIGTLSPTGNLTVIPASNPTTVAAATQIQVGEASDASQYRMSVGYYLGSSLWTGVIQSMANGVGGLLVLNPLGGNVGVGTQAPSAVFHVALGTVGIGPVIATRLDSLDSNAVTSEVRMVLAEGGSWYQGISGAYGNGAPYLAFSVNGIGSPNTWAERMRITATGAVGIGKVPAYSLDVSGDCNITGTYRVNGTPLATGGGGGGITAQSIVTGSRALGGIYQVNPAGKPTFVCVTLNIPSSGAGATAYSDSGSNPSNVVAQMSLSSGANSGVLTLSFWVLPGNYMKVLQIGSASIFQWVEWF